MIQRLRRGKTQRSNFVESHIRKTLAFQIRSLREREDWSQQRLAEKIGSNQNAVYRAENPNYGKQTITTLKKIAAAFDVALVVRFVPFSELIDWVSGTPHVNDGLNSEALTVPGFDAEDKGGKFNEPVQKKPRTLQGLSSDAEAYEYIRNVDAQRMTRAVETVRGYPQQNLIGLTKLQEPLIEQQYTASGATVEFFVASLASAATNVKREGSLTDTMAGLNESEAAIARQIGHIAWQSMSNFGGRVYTNG